MSYCYFPHHPDRADHHPAVPGTMFCKSATERLTKTIAELPALHSWLHANLASGGGGGDKVTGTRDKPVPINLGVHDHAEHVVFTLASWARMVAEDRGLHGPSNATPSATATFLLAHLDWIVRQDWAPDAAEEISDLSRKAHGIVPSRPERHELPAPCPADGCGYLSLVRYDGESHVRCEVCGAVWDEKEYVRLTIVLADEAKRNPAVVEVDGEQYATPGTLAMQLGRPERTIRTWMRRNHLRHVQQDGVLLVSVEDTRARHEAREEGAA